MGSFTQFKPTSIREGVGEMIRQALYEGRLEPGHSLSEAGLAAEMGVSRGPVREALLLLSQEGLVVHSPNRGFAVVQLTDNDLEEIRRVRLPLEIMALTVAKPRICDADIAKLVELKTRMVDEFGTNLRESTQSDISFHALIWERTGNLHLVATLRNLLAPFFAFGSLSSVHHKVPLTKQHLAEQHDQIIQFLQGSNDFSAEDCVRFHLGL
jgi:DNA-binding GntR family transcriptional regulator